MSYFVYILYSKSTDSFYKGQTSDLIDRLARHNNGQEKVTRSGAPWTLLWSIGKDTRSEALLFCRSKEYLPRGVKLKYRVT